MSIYVMVMVNIYCIDILYLYMMVMVNIYICRYIISMRW